MRRPSRLLLVLLGLTAPVGGVKAQSVYGPPPPDAEPATAEAEPATVESLPIAPQWSAEERAVIELLRGLRKKEHARDKDIGVRLAVAGERVLPLFLELLVARSVPPLEEGEPQILSEVQEKAILAAVTQLEREPVLAEVKAALGAGEPRRRHAALGCIGAVGRANDLLPLFELALGPEAPQGTELEKGMARALQRAVTSVLARDPFGFEQLVSLRRITRPELVPALIVAVGATRDPRGLLYLSEVAYWNNKLVADVMGQVPLLGPSGDEAVDGAMKVRLRAYLDENEPGTCRAAITALTALGDEECIAALIPLLESESAGLRENAHWGLKQLTGLSLAPTPEMWSRWHRAELYWLVREKPKLFKRLRENDPAVVADALRTILTHPLAQRELATALPDLLKSRWKALRILACRTLADLGAREAVGRLVWALEDPDVEVATAAHAALRSLTGLDLPREPAAWHQATNTEPRGTQL